MDLPLLGIIISILSAVIGGLVVWLWKHDRMLFVMHGDMLTKHEFQLEMVILRDRIDRIDRRFDALTRQCGKEENGNAQGFKG